MCNSILDELKEVKYFTRNKRFHKSKCKTLSRNKMFEESLSKSSVVFRIQASTYDGVFL